MEHGYGKSAIVLLASSDVNITLDAVLEAEKTRHNNYEEWQNMWQMMKLHVQLKNMSKCSIKTISTGRYKEIDILKLVKNQTKQDLRCLHKIG